LPVRGPGADVPGGSSMGPVGTGAGTLRLALYLAHQVCWHNDEVCLEVCLGVRIATSAGVTPSWCAQMSR
jgi:hypothetical protein